MNFCPKCQFMLYTRLNDSKNLEHFCKNCDWSGSEFFDDKESVCVYSKNYSNEFIALKTLTNKYTLHDPTLPRISNIECVNVKCLTNLEDINADLTLHLCNIGSLYLESGMLSEFLSAEPYLIESDNYTITPVNEEEILITFNDKVDYDKLSTLDNIVIGENKIKLKQYVKPNREIIFMKYDNVNLKYLYMCSTCRTTWKTE